jgi:hypothetical protein
MNALLARAAGQVLVTVTGAVFAAYGAWDAWAGHDT